MTLDPTALDALDAAAATLAGGGATGTAVPDASSPANPLRWDGYQYTCWPSANVERNAAGVPVDMMGNELPPRPVGAGWFVFAHGDPNDPDSNGWGGYVVDVWTADDPETGERGALTTYTVARARRGLVERDDIAAEAVTAAHPPERRGLSALAVQIHRQLGAKRGTKAEREWLAGVVGLIERLAAAS